MICYRQGIFFKKMWYWFEDPRDVQNVAMVNFFSYNEVEASGFSRKMGITTVINLNSSIDDIWNATRKSFIREQIKRGENAGISIKRGYDFEKYAVLDKQFRKSKGLPRYRLSALMEKGLLFAAYFKDELIAGAIAISDGINMRALVLSSLHGVDKGKQNIIGQGNRMVMWNMIQYAKETHHESFDLGGIDLDQKGEPTPLALFKEAFGGVRKETFFYHKVYSPFLRRLIVFKNTLTV